ncbi:unnamed protein product, partial [Rotaria sordida]
MYVPECVYAIAVHAHIDKVACTSPVEFGDKLKYGGERVDNKDYVIKATIFSGVKDDTQIAREERKLDPAARAQLIHKLADLLPCVLDYLARLKIPSSEKLPQESYCEILGAAICLDYYAGWADEITGETFPLESSIFITYIKHESVGIYEQIILCHTQLETILECIRSGKKVGDKGYFIRPAIFTNVKDDMKVAREE